MAETVLAILLDPALMRYGGALPPYCKSGGGLSPLFPLPPDISPPLHSYMVYDPSKNLSLEPLRL